MNKLQNCINLNFDKNKITDLRIIIFLKYFFTSLLSVLILSAAAQKEILLWPNGAPGSEGKTGEEKISTSARGERKKGDGDS